MNIRYSIQTPAAAPGAIAVLELVADDIDAAMESLGMLPVPAGSARLRDLMGVDRGIVARWAPGTAHLMPHGGVQVVREIARRLEARGVCRGVPHAEAARTVESRMLAALARARSPLAIDLLLDQPRRWAGVPARPPNERDHVLRRLIHPPLVVALGPPNVGKSSLLNALAGRGVSIVADEPGTTRDHVGATLDLSGLVVRFVDTPGLRPGAGGPESDAAELALELARTAHLVLLVGDVTAPAPAQPASGPPALVVASRGDLGLPNWPHDVAVSARTGSGLGVLASRVRDRLVPPETTADAAPWVFWEDGD